MKNAGSRYAKRILSAGASRPATIGFAQRLAALPAGDGTGASAARLALAFALLAVAAFALLNPAPAAADTRHPVQTLQFGSDGTSATTFNEEIKSVTYDQKHNRLYVLTWPPGEKGKVYGFDNPSPGVYTPRAGFPVITAMPNFEATIVADDSEGPHSGRVYFVRQSQGNEEIYAIEPDGSFPTSWPVPVRSICDADVDADGNVWVSQSWPEYKLLQISGEDGTQLAEFPLPFDPCKLTFDNSTGDLYVHKNSPQPEGYYRLTAESDYQGIEGPFSTSNFLGIFSNNIRDFAFDGATSRLYVARWHYQEKTPGNNVPYNLVYGLQPDGQFIEVFPESQTFSYSQTYKSVDVNEDSGDVFVADEAGGNVIRVFSSVVVPDVTTGDQTANDEISGTVNRAGAGAITDCFFEYATDAYFDSHGETYDQEIACEPSTAFDEDRTVTATVPGLVNETVYHYRLVAENADGQGTGTDRILEPHDIDFLKTRPATSVTRQTATLNGSFVGNGENTTYYFQWGVDDVEENESAPDDADCPDRETPVSQPVTGLTAGTVYRFRVIAEAGPKKSIAQELTFETSAAIKGITTLPATNVEPSQATLNGSLDPDGYVTHFYFEYGKTKSYGQKVPVPPGDEVGTTAPGSTPVETLATNLEPGTTYHFRLVADNESGVTKGGDQIFTTPQAPSVNGFSSRQRHRGLGGTHGPDRPERLRRDGLLRIRDDAQTTDRKSTSRRASSSSPTGPQDVVVTIEGLSSNTYHFRLVAENQWGETVTEDQTFDFLAPIGCPNHAVRQQTGAAYLPDCRAYELVSAARAAGALACPAGPDRRRTPRRPAASRTPAASTRSRALVNRPTATKGDLYMASRTTSGWVTRYVGIAGEPERRILGPPRTKNSASRLLAGTPTDLGMNKILIWDGRSPASSADLCKAATRHSSTTTRANLLERCRPTSTKSRSANRPREGGFRGAANPRRLATTSSPRSTRLRARAA